MSPISKEVQLHQLSPGILIGNIATGKRFEIITVNPSQIMLKSTTGNNIFCMPMTVFDTKDWQLLNIEG